jgi:hypothetical protein
MMNWRRFLPHIAWGGALAVMALLWLWQARASATARGADKERLRVSDSVVAVRNRESAALRTRISVLRVDSAAMVARIGRLRADSGRLATAAVQIRATAQQEFERWQRVVQGWEVYADSVPGLRELLNQGTAALNSCRAETANCEQRAANAEKRVADVDLQRLNAEARAANLDTARANAEDRTREFARQAATWERIARPSLWEQLKQIPGRVLTTSAIYSAGYFTCRAIG